MEQTYKGFLIRSSASAFHDSVGFKPVAKISWTENGQERVKLWMEWAFERSFDRYKDAERAAYIFAKDWVDSNRDGYAGTGIAGFSS